MKRSLLIGLAALTLAACATNPLTPASDTVPVAQTVTAIDASYNVVAQAYLAALPTMPASVKAQVKPVLVQAYAAVQAADTAETLGEATTVNAQINTATTLLAQARALLGK